MIAILLQEKKHLPHQKMATNHGVKPRKRVQNERIF
jgi:hypothetical protein